MARRSRSAPPRVDRSFSFVDLCGFTDFADEHGDDEAATVLHLLRAAVREAATNHGVRVDKWLGDGAMLVSVEPEPLLAAVVEAKWAVAEEGPLALRAGLARGPVMVFEGDDYVGRAVNLASKLCDLAEPGHVLAAGDLADVCPVGLRAEPTGSRVVPGFHLPIELFEIDVTDDDAGRHRRGLGVALGRTVKQDVASPSS